MSMQPNLTIQHMIPIRDWKYDVRSGSSSGLMSIPCSYLVGNGLGFSFGNLYLSWKCCRHVGNRPKCHKFSQWHDMLWCQLLEIPCKKGVPDNNPEKRNWHFYFVCIFEFFGTRGVKHTQKRKNMFRSKLFCPKVWRFLGIFSICLNILRVAVSVAKFWDVETFNTPDRDLCCGGICSDMQSLQFFTASLTYLKGLMPNAKTLFSSYMSLSLALRLMSGVPIESGFRGKF